MDSSFVTQALAVLVAYLLGSVPFGIVITRALGLGDLRKIGSGNIGATNVLRTGNKGLAALTLVLDAAKGAAAVLIARAYHSPDLAAIAALGALFGHLFPVWLKFNGGKGVATYIGVLAALARCLAVIDAGVPRLRLRSGAEQDHDAIAVALGKRDDRLGERAAVDDAGLRIADDGAGR